MKILGLLLLSALGSANNFPAQPTEPGHPGNAVYEYQAQKTSFEINGRRVDVFLPEGKADSPVVVYGHGQAIGLDGYEATFVHLARKGVAVVFPEFDNGFFDQDWRRMAKDFNELTAAALAKFPEQMDANRIVFSGHSKGAYIALMAAGDTRKPTGLTGVVLFAPAGYDAEYLKRMEPLLPVTILWGEADSVIKRSAQSEIYGKLPARYKQFIEVKSYTNLRADHYFPMSKSYFFGGRNGISPFHYHGAWKWILGAAFDGEGGRSLSNPYIYGEEAATSGLPGLNHNLTRSW